MENWLSAISRKLTFSFQFSTQKSPVRTTVPRQVMKHAVRNPCKKSFKTNQSAEGATEKHLCRVFSTFYIILVMNAGVPCFSLHRLPGNCRHYVTFGLGTGIGNGDGNDFLRRVRIWFIKCYIFLNKIIQTIFVIRLCFFSCHALYLSHPLRSQLLIPNS